VILYIDKLSGDSFEIKTYVGETFDKIRDKAPPNPKLNTRAEAAAAAAAAVAAAAACTLWCADQLTRTAR
jgi:hypothetical protein